MKRDAMKAEPVLSDLSLATSVIQEGKTHSTPVACSRTNEQPISSAAQQ